MDSQDSEVYPRYPFCVVWTPIPIISWIFPFIGHVGICTAEGVIRDFAGSYFVSEDRMGFGLPTKYWKLNPEFAKNGAAGWDAAVIEASVIYGKKIHNLFLENCHSHVCTALNLIEYRGSTNWNAFKLVYNLILHGKYISTGAWIKTWVPFFVNAIACSIIYFGMNSLV